MKHIIVGLGSIGQRHLANLKMLRPDDKFITVDTNGKADYDGLSPDYGLDIPIYDSIVYICSPAQRHYTHLFLALVRGARAIFVEKPLFGEGNVLDDVINNMAR